MVQDWNFYTKGQILNPGNVNAGNISNYQRMLKNTDPTIPDPYRFEFTQGSKVAPKVVKRADVALPTQIERNVAQTGRGIAKGGKIVAKGAGKALPFVGAGTSIYDAGRSFQIADNMEKINSIQPGTFDKGAIDYYRNKGKTIAALSGIGAAGGAVLGSGALSVPGAAAGMGVGGAIGDLGYRLFQIDNPYKDTWENTPAEIKALLYNKQDGDSTSSSGIQSTPPTTDLNGQPQYELMDDNKLTGGVSIPTNTAKLRGVTPTATGNIAQGNVQQAITPEQQQANLEAINNYIARLQQINQPYINSLQNYLNNYNKMVDQRNRAARFWQGAASLTGNPAWANMANNYSPLTNEANRVAAVKQLQDAKAADVNAITEALGNMAAAQDIGLSPEAAFANKNLLSAISSDRKLANDLQKAQLMADTRLYGYDTVYNRALWQQLLRNQGAERVANIYAGGYGGVAPGLNAQGTIPIMYNNTQVPVQQADPRAQFFPTK